MQSKILFEVWYPKDASFRDVPEGSKWDSSKFLKVAEFKADNLDDLFLMLNADDNPLGASGKQDFIRDNKLHTSMSVGDVAVIKETGDIFICASTGWTKLEPEATIGELSPEYIEARFYEQRFDA